MKAKLLRTMQQCSPALLAVGQDLSKLKPGEVPFVDLPEGSIIDHPDVAELVKAGIAEPADDECRKAAPLTEEELRIKGNEYDLRDQGLEHPPEKK